MINEIPIHDYYSINNNINSINDLDIPKGDFMLYLQTYEQVNNSKDIISICNDNKRLFVRNNQLLYAEFTDIIDLPLKTIVEYTLKNERYSISDVKYVFLAIQKRDAFLT